MSANMHLQMHEKMLVNLHLKIHLYASHRFTPSEKIHEC
jgi:hypothetical protein